VISVGQVTNHEVYLALSDVLCLPSYREGFGTIVIDAAAMGVPTIGTRIPGLVDAIEDGHTGLLVEAGNVGALVEMMQRVVNQPEVLASMREEAKRRTAELFSADVVYAALRDTYLRLLAP
jgi:glycosyltransferase involved in cell wall biosynthesis